MTGRYLLTLAVKGHMMVCMSEPATTTGERIPEWTLGWRLKRALHFADLSAQDMAAELGVHVGTVSRWMNDRETPRRAYLMAWALRCGVPYGWLAGNEANGSHIRALIRDQQPGYAEIGNDITAMRKALGHGQRRTNARSPIAEPADPRSSERAV